jgi:UDP-glucose 4-epimerase
MSDTKPILVTGGAGFIGSHLVERLLAEGRHVIVIDDFSTGSRENLQAVQAHARLKIIAEKISACPELPRLVGSAEAVFHLAAAVGVELVLRSPMHTLKTNLLETLVLLEAAGSGAVPVLLASTSEVYGKSEQACLSEDDNPVLGPSRMGRWGYACSKLMDEFLAFACARERGLPVIVARLFNTVGPRQSGRHGMVLPRFIEAARTGAPLRVFGDGLQTRSFSSVGDTVEALLRLIRCPDARGQIFNVGGTEEVRILTLAERVVALMGSTSPIELVPYADAYPAGFEDMQRRRPNVDKLERFTGFRPRTPLDAIIAAAAGLPLPRPGGDTVSAV